TRGDATDSIHYGSVAVVDGGGRILYAAGDPSFVTMTRSSLKPLQAVPLVAAGGVERFGFSSEQVALLCASHSGEPRHVTAVAAMLRATSCPPPASHSRRCSTIARASIRGCWLIAGTVDYRLRPTWRSTIRCRQPYARRLRT